MDKPTTRINVAHLEQQALKRDEIKTNPSDQNSVIALRDRVEKLEQALGLR